MKSFKKFLLEYLTDEQRSKYSNYTMSDKARADTDHFFGVGNDRVYGEIQHDDKSEIHKQLETHLNREITHDEYKRGMVKDKYGRDAKIGKLIKDNNLRLQFDKDPSRLLSYRPTMKTTTVRGVDVAGQTNPSPNVEHPVGHSWCDSSCKNIENGINNRYLPKEIEHGTVVHFVHDHNGQEIYRATLQPHHNEQGHVAYALDAEYGIKHPSFTKDAQRVASELSGEFKPGVFYKHKEVYNDNGIRKIFHPSMTDEYIDRIIDHGASNTVADIASHPKFNSTHLQRVLDNDISPGLKAVALSKARNIITPEHITSILNMPGKDSETNKMKAYVIRIHDKITPEHLEKALGPDMPTNVRLDAASHPKMTSHLITNVIKDHRGDDYGVVQRAIHHHHADVSHISAALKHDDPRVRVLAFRRSDLVTDDHISKGIRDPDENVRLSAAKLNLKAKDIDYLIRNHNGRGGVLETAVYGSDHVTPEHIHAILHDTTPGLRDAKLAAIEHPNASYQNIMDGLKSGDRDIVYSAATHKNIHPDHINYVIDNAAKLDPHETIQSSLAKKRNLSSENITKMLNTTKRRDIKRLLAIHPNLTPEHIDHIIHNEPDGSLRSTFAEMAKNITPEQLIHVVKHDPDEDVRQAALFNKNATQEVYRQSVLHDPSDSNTRLAIRRVEDSKILQHVVDDSTGKYNKQHRQEARSRLLELGHVSQSGAKFT